MAHRFDSERHSRVRAAVGTVICLLMVDSATAQAQECAPTVAKFRQASVRIRVEGTLETTGEIKRSNGTGVVVSSDGFVLTNSHVVNLGRGINNIAIQGSIGSAKSFTTPLSVIADEPGPDLALLKFTNTSQQYAAAPIGDVAQVSEGASLCTFGYPLDSEFHSTGGRLSAKSGPAGWWTSDIATNPGESGSPVFSQAGNLIGLRVAGRDDATGIYYFVPINLAANLLRLVPGKPSPVPEVVTGPDGKQFSLFVPRSLLERDPSVYVMRLGIGKGSIRILVDSVRVRQASYATVLVEGGISVSPLSEGDHEILVMSISEDGGSQSQVAACTFTLSGRPRALRLEGSDRMSRPCEIREDP